MPLNKSRAATPLALALACAMASAFAPAQAADVVVQPSAGSSLIVTDSAGGAQRLRVQEDGRIALPGWQGLAQQTGPMCIDVTLGFVGPCPTTTGFSLPYSAAVSAAVPLMALSQSGSAGVLRLGVGQSNNSSTVLDVSTTGLGNGIDLQLPATSNARALYIRHNGSGPGVYANTAVGHSLWGVAASMSAAAVIGDNPSGEAIVGRQTGTGCANMPDKCRGIGAVVGRHDGEGGYGVRGFVTSPNGAIGVLGQAGTNGGQGVAGRFENQNATNTFNTLEVSTAGSGTAVHVAGGANTQDLVVLTSSGTKVARIDKSGKGFFNNGTQTGGADIAEVIDTRGPLPQPGDVVEIDPVHPLHYRLSSGAQSPLVAGVVTTRPGVLMNAGTQDATGLPALALAGRVPVKVTLEGGPIQAGDLLVSASIPGHAARAPAQLVPGTVIGKAMQGHGQGQADTGVIEMLVMLR